MCVFFHFFFSFYTFRCGFQQCFLQWPSSIKITKFTHSLSESVWNCCPNAINISNYVFTRDGFSCLSANASTEYFLYLFPICRHRRQRSDSCTVVEASNGFSFECLTLTSPIDRCYFFVHHCTAAHTFRSAHRNWCYRPLYRCQHHFHYNSSIRPLWLRPASTIFWPTQYYCLSMTVCVWANIHVHGCVALPTSPPLPSLSTLINR